MNEDDVMIGDEVRGDVGALPAPEPSGPAVDEIARLAAFPLNNPNPVLEADFSGRVTFANPATRRILERLGLGDEDARLFLPQDLADIIRLSDGGHETSLDRAVTIGGRSFNETVLVTPESRLVRIYAYDVTDLKRAEQEVVRLNQDLRRRVDELQTIFDTVPIGLAIADDHEGRRIRGNPAIERMIGVLQGGELSLGASQPACYRVLRDGVELEVDELPMQRACHGEIVDGQTIEIGREDGKTAVLFCKAAPLFDEDGRPRGAVGAFLDITEQKRAEDAVHRSEEQQKLFIEHAPAALAMFDREMRYLSVSRRWLGDYGLEGRDLIGACHYDIFPELPAEWKEAHRRGLAGEVVRGESDRFERADGSVQWERWEVRPWFSAADEVGGIVIFSEDITGIMQAEEALRESEELFRTLADAIPQLCWMAGADGWISWYNRRWYDYTGTTPEQMTGWGWQSVHDPGVLPGVMERWQASIESGKPFDMVFPLRGADGVFRPFLTRILPVCDQDGTVVRWFGTSTDISEQLSVQEALRRSNARLDLLAENAGRLLASDSPQRIVDGLCRKVMTFLDCHAFFNYLVVEEAGRLHLNASAGIPEEEARKIEWLDYGAAVCGSAARDVCRIVAEDIPNTPDPRTELVKSYGIQAYACHPLMIQGRLLGTLSFGTRTRSRFTDDELALMKTVADQVAVALERNKSEEELRRAHDELEARVAERTEELASAVNVLQEEIVERERAEEALRGSEKKFRTLFEESKDVIFIMNVDGRLLDANPAGPELLGYSREELIDMDVATLYGDPADRTSFRQLLFAQGFVRDYEVRMKKKSGEPLFVLMTASVVRDEQGEVTGYRGILHDVTERKRLEQQLLQAQKMESIGLLAGGVAHDFNNLLTAISGYSQIIQEQFATRDEMLAMCIEQVLEATKRGVELTRNLLAFGRRQIINPHPVDVNDLVAGVGKLLARIIGEDIELDTHLADARLAVMADRGQIDQVLINLATNARDAMPKGGMLLIRTGQVELDRNAARQRDLDVPGAYALISVADTGQGMDRETMTRIFEPFFTTKETGKGTGLGLSIIYGIVKQHNGTIAVESEPGIGTTFTIYLPLVEGVPHEAPRGDAPAPAGGSETILLAEDDPMVRKYMQKILEMAGYSLILARNGEEAVQLYREHGERIALVLCDVVMPKKNGKEVYDEIRAMAPGARFLFTSGYNDEIIHTKGILLDEIEFLVKPVNRQELLLKLRELLDA